jgi:serine/threonine-protein kinase RsbW
MREYGLDTSNLTMMFHEVTESRRELIGDVVERIMSIVRAMPCAQENLDTIALALNETLANAVIHGNREDPGKKVEIYGACEGEEKLLLVVTDEGQGFDPAAIPDPTTAEQIFSSHGRGLFLINQLMCTPEFRLGGRQVVLRKSVGRAKKSEAGTAPSPEP